MPERIGFDEKPGRKSLKGLYRKVRTSAAKLYRSGRRRIRSFIYQFSYRSEMALRQVGFKSSLTKRREFEEAASDGHLLFSTDLVKTGFSDQLFGFAFLYSLGRKLGMTYSHTDLSSHRSSIPFLFDPRSREEKEDVKRTKNGKDIFDVIGLNKYLENRSEYNLSQNLKQVRVDLDLILKGREVKNFDHLVSKLKALLRPFLSKRGKVLFLLKAEPATYFRFYKELTEQDMNEIDFHRSYQFHSILKDIRPSFKSDRLKIFVHVRQGDTATIETPWNTFIPVWHSVQGKFTQFQKKSDIDQPRSVETEIFYDFLKGLYEEELPEKSTVVYSDGYKKAFRWIYKYSRKKHLSEDELSRLMKMEQGYDEQKFSAFRSLPDVNTVIGEEPEKLHQLMVDFMHADILIAGTQQVMIPKLYRMYRYREKCSLLIILYKSTKPHFEYIGFRGDEEQILYVNVENPDFREVQNAITAHLQKKAKRAGMAT